MKKIKIEGVPPISPKNSGIGYYNNHTNTNLLLTTNNQFGEVNPPEPEINSTVKPVDKKDATIEAEHGELLIQPGLTAIHKILGKKHSKGGTPLAPIPGSFIISDDKNLAFTKSEKKLFDFKQTNNSAKKNTPSKILQKEVDIKNYNKMVDALSNDKSDVIAKTTAELMLQKHQNKIGQVALLQEYKKGGLIPDFAQPPAINPNIQTMKNEQEMYNMGGKYPDGGPYKGDKYAPRAGQQKKGLKKGFNAFDAPWLTDYGYTNDWSGINKALTDLGFNNGSAYGGNDSKAMQKFLVDENVFANNYNVLNDLMSNFGLTTQGVKKNVTAPEGFDYQVNDTTPFDSLYDQFADGIFGRRSGELLKALLQQRKPNDPRITIPNSNSPWAMEAPVENSLTANPIIPTKGNQATPVNNVVNDPYKIKGRLTPAQRANLAYLGAEAMSVKRYMPKREQVNLPQVNFDLINAQPMINQVNNQAYLASQTAGLNPRTAALNASNIYGKSIDALSQIYGNVNNQNIQISNQENLTNLQQSTNQVLRNNELDSRYYDQTVTANENYDREKRFARNQFVSTLNKYQSDADQLAWALASVNKYGNRKYLGKDGKIHNTPTPLYEVTDNGINYNADVANLNMASGANRINSVQEIQNIAKQFGINVSDPKQALAFAKLYEAITGKGKNALYQNSPILPQ